MEESIELQDIGDDRTAKKQHGKKSTIIFIGEKSTWTIIGTVVCILVRMKSFFDLSPKKQQW